MLKLSNKSGEIVRKIPIDDHGMMFVNYQGLFKTFYYLPYVYCKDPDLLPPEYWIDKIAIVGSSAPGLMDLRNTPVQETFAGVEIHANVLYSILNNEFVQTQDQKVNLSVNLNYERFIVTCTSVLRSGLDHQQFVSTNTNIIGNGHMLTLLIN